MDPARVGYLFDPERFRFLKVALFTSPHWVEKPGVRGILSMFLSCQRLPLPCGAEQMAREKVHLDYIAKELVGHVEAALHNKPEREISPPHKA